MIFGVCAVAGDARAEVNLPFSLDSPVTYTLDYSATGGAIFSFRLSLAGVGTVIDLSYGSTLLSGALAPGDYLLTAYANALARDTGDHDWELQLQDPAGSAPEPSTTFLLGTGLVGLVGYARRKKQH